jgi:hypothetical protein
MIIGIAGTKGSGKDTIALQLKKEYEFHHIKFAEPLKEMLRVILQYRGASLLMIDAMLEGDRKEVPSEYFSGRTPRHAMQTLGTEWGRNCIASDLWTSIAAERTAAFAKFANVVISDIRFPNEVECVHKLGGEVWRVIRDMSHPADQHPSEIQVAGLHCDYTIYNLGTLEQLYTKITNLMVKP